MCEPQSILGCAQTYVGVLATFIVLCLFISKSENQSNFIIYTILKVGEDFTNHLKIFINQVNSEVYTQCANEVMNKELAELHALDDKEKKKKLLAYTNKLNLLSSKITKNALSVSDEFERDKHLDLKRNCPISPSLVFASSLQSCSWIVLIFRFTTGACS